MPDLAEEVEDLEEEAEEKAEEAEKKTEEVAAIPAAAVVNVPQELTQPVVDHAGRIARIEERQAQHDIELARQLADMEGRLSEGFNARLSALESKLAQAAEEPPEELAELADEEVEVPAVQKEERARGIRGRRKARRGK